MTYVNATRDDIVATLAGHYQGLHSSKALWIWAGLPMAEYQWQGTAQNTWNALIDQTPSHALLKQALFDHPGHPVYLSCLSQRSVSPLVTQSVDPVITYLSACPPHDQTYRLMEWMPLCPRLANADEFVVAIAPHIQGRWTQADRYSLEARIDALLHPGNAEEPELSLGANAALSLINAVDELVSNDRSTDKLQPVLDQLRRRFSLLITFSQQHQGVDLMIAAEDELTAAESEVQFLEQLMRDRGAQNPTPLLLAACEYSRDAVATNDWQWPTAYAEAWRQALWATTGATPHSPYLATVAAPSTDGNE